MDAYSSTNEPPDAIECAARVGGRRFRETTGEESLDRAKDVAEAWYLDLRGKLRNGMILPDSARSARRPKAISARSRSSPRRLAVPNTSKTSNLRMNRHVLPYFGDKPLSAVNRGLVQAYRVKRAEETIERTKTDHKPASPPPAIRC